jgi:hypothetical protein
LEGRIEKLLKTLTPHDILLRLYWLLEQRDGRYILQNKQCGLSQKIIESHIENKQYNIRKRYNEIGTKRGFHGYRNLLDNKYITYFYSLLNILSCIILKYITINGIIIDLVNKKNLNHELEQEKEGDNLEEVEGLGDNVRDYEYFQKVDEEECDYRVCIENIGKEKEKIKEKEEEKLFIDLNNERKGNISNKSSVETRKRKHEDKQVQREIKSVQNEMARMTLQHDIEILKQRGKSSFEFDAKRKKPKNAKI